MIDTLLLGLVGLSLLFGQLGRVSLGNGVRFYALELLVLLHALVILARRIKYKQWLPNTKLFQTVKAITSPAKFFDGFLVKLRRVVRAIGVMPNIPKLTVLWFVYLAFLFLFTAGGKSLADNITAAMYIARITLFGIYFYLLILTHVSKRLAKYILLAIAALIPSICLIQYIMIPDLRFLAQFGWDPHMYRAVGLIFDPPIVGVMLGVLLIVSLRTALPDDLDNEQNKYTNSLNRVKYYVPVLLNFLAVIFLYSRSTYIAVILSVFMFFILRKRFGYAMAWLVVVTTCIYLAPRTIPPYFVLESAKIERVSTVMSRKVEIQNGLRVWFDHPIFGIGYNRVAEYKKSLPTTYGAGVVSNHSSSAFHSFWLTQLATTGIVGFVLLVGVYMLSMKRSLYWALTLSIPALVGLIDNVVFHPFVLILFILIYFSKVLDQPNSHALS